MPRMNSTEQEMSTNSLPPLVEPSYSAGPGSSFTDGESEFKAGIDPNMATPSNSSKLNNTTFTNPNNITSNINYTIARGYRMNPSPNQTVLNPQVQANTDVFRVTGPAANPTNPTHYYHQLGNINLAQCKVEPYQSGSLINGQDRQYTGLSTNWKSVPQFEDIIGTFINNTEYSNTVFGLPWDD